MGLTDGKFGSPLNWPYLPTFPDVSYLLFQNTFLVRERHGDRVGENSMDGCGCDISASVDGFFFSLMEGHLASYVFLF